MFVSPKPKFCAVIFFRQSSTNPRPNFFIYNVKMLIISTEYYNYYDTVHTLLLLSKQMYYSPTVRLIHGTENL